MDPKYKMPGKRSTAGSGLDESANSMSESKVGRFAEPGFNSDPSGAANVTYQNGASTPITAAFPTGREGMAPLTYSED